MNRRDTSKTSVGVVMAPLIRLNLLYKTDIATLVNEFCATHDCLSRFNITSPWVLQDDTVASDGQALIRVPDLRYVRIGGETKRPDVNEMFTQFWPEETARRKWMPLPTPRRQIGCNWSADFCPNCARGTCPTCEGGIEGIEGEGCKTCRDHGYIPDPACSICHGSYEDIAWLESWNDIYVSARYADLVRRIPGARWLPGQNETAPILIRGDGGVRALVLPVSNTQFAQCRTH